MLNFQHVLLVRDSMEDHLERVYAFYGYTGRPFLKQAWKQVVGADISVLEAPTGYGKTTISQAFSLYSIEEEFKQIIGYPLRTLLEDQYAKFAEMTRGMSLGDIVGTRYMHHIDSCFFVKPVTLTTVDTLSMTLFGLEPIDLERTLLSYYGGWAPDSITFSTGHYLFSRASVLLSNIVLDEVHLLADSTRSLNFLASLIIIARQNGVKLLLESATLPEALVSVLKKIDDEIQVIPFDESVDPEFIEEREARTVDYMPPSMLDEENKYGAIMEYLLEAKKTLAGEALRAILVFNTVEEAMEMYDYLLRHYRGGEEIILLHSRFTERDRREKAQRLAELTDMLKKEIREGVTKPSTSYIVVATQVIEAGVDISSNVFITDIAPANSLIQRLGRFLRYPGERNGLLRIWYDHSLNDNTKLERYKVYDKELVKKTLEWLQGRHCFNPHVPAKYRCLLNSVYSTDDYSVELSEVEDLVSLTLMLRSPGRAVEKFVKLGGSFIRDSILVPVIPEDMARSNERLEPIPLSLNTVARLARRGAVIGVLLKRDNQCVKDRIKGIQLIKKYRLAKLVLRPDVVALLIKASYDPAKGLVVE